MDAGCYAVHLLRTRAGSEPKVSSATAKTRRTGVDRLLTAELAFPGGCTGLITASMLSRNVLGAGVRVGGTSGAMRVFNPIAPQRGHGLVVRSDTRRAVEHVPRQPSTYACQLRAFTGAILRGEPSSLDQRMRSQTWRSSTPVTQRLGRRGENRVPKLSGQTRVLRCQPRPGARSR
jgi:predicted dehydrogenase